MVSLYVLCALNVVIAIAIAVCKRDAKQLLVVDPPLLVRWGGLYTPFVRRGQYWRLVTAMFLHANIQHLLANTGALLVIGLLAGKRLGEPLFVATYLVSGFAGCIVSYAARRNRVVHYDEPFWRIMLVPNPLAVAVGASGAICGLIAATMIDAHVHDDVDTYNALVQWIVMIAAYSFVPGVDKFGHLGGVLAGIAFGYVGGHAGLDMPALALVPVVVAAAALWIARQRGGAAGDTVDQWTRRAAEAREAKDTETEIAAYQQSLALHPRNAAASFNIALAFERKGDLASALAHAEQTVAMVSGEKSAVRLRDRLARAVMGASS